MFEEEPGNGALRTSTLSTRYLMGPYPRRSRTRITDADRNRAAWFSCPSTAQAARLAKFTLLLRPRGGNVRGFVLLAPQPREGHSGTLDGYVLPGTHDLAT